MANKRGREGARAGAWRVTKKVFEFYALLGTLFSLRRRRIRRRRAQGYVSINVTALTALVVCLFKFKVFDAVF